MNKIDLEYIDKYNIKLGWGYYFEYNVFKKLLEPHLKEIINSIPNEYISIIKEGEFHFCHYGPSNIKEIKPSMSTYENNFNLTLCDGIYCYNSDTHEPVNCKEGISIYYGKYNGKYVECIVDPDGNDINDKATGNLKEYVLLTDTRIKFDKEIRF